MGLNNRYYADKDCEYESLPLPKYETAQSAGMDLRAYLPEGPVTLKPMQRGLVKSGLFMEPPAGYEAQVRPRSGLALKNGKALETTDDVENDENERLVEVFNDKEMQDEEFGEMLNEEDRGSRAFARLGRRIGRVSQSVVYKWVYNKGVGLTDNLHYVRIDTRNPVFIPNGMHPYCYCHCHHVPLCPTFFTHKVAP